MAGRAAARVAAARPRYLRELAEGTERFFLPRRDDCPWCGSRRVEPRLRTADLFQGKPGRFTLERCRDCGHVFQNPRLSDEGLAFYYRDFYDGLGAESTGRLLGGRGSERRFRASARAVARFAPAPGRWLDVGTAHGFFCQAAARELPGTRFDGLDRGEAVHRAAAAGRIARAYQGSLPQWARHLAGRYDVVSMFHCLEHTTDPRRELAAARTVLRPGGLLVVEVPDPRSRYARLLGRWWLPWLQPQHLHLVPTGNLVRELERLGFEVLRAERGTAHVPNDLVCAAWLRYSRLLPPEDVPWRAAPPGRLARTVRAALVPPAVPLLLAVYTLDLLLAPVARRTALANAYRVIARRHR